MSYYRPIYPPEAVDEESILQHRLALAGQSDVMELARLTRMRDVEFTSSFMRYAQPRVGMYQELTTVYGDQCLNPPVTQQSSFESEEGFSAQPYRSYPYGSSDGRIPAQEYISPSNTLIGNVNQRQIVAGSQSIAPMPSISENQTLDHDLPTVFSRSDMQWLTTSSTDMRTQSPLNTSSPRSKMPPLYPSQPTPPNVSLLQQSSLDDSPSASLGRHQFRQQTTPGTSSQAAPSSRSKKASSSNPTKPKGTPGRKRKFQDHELTPEEATKRRIRRERNKVAAAKCRNRRRELTDRLQGETDHLEDHQSFLQQEILTLQQQKEHLEFILAAHSPNCKAAGILPDSGPLVSDEPQIIEANRMTNISFTPNLPIVEEMIGETPSDSHLYYLQGGQSTLQTPQIVSSRDTSRRTDMNLENPVKIETPSELENQSLASRNIPTDLSNHAGSFPASSISTGISRPTLNLDDLGEHKESLNTPVCTLATPSSNTGVFSFSTLTPTACSTTTESSFLYPHSSSIVSTKDSVSPRTPSYGTVQSCAVSYRRSSSDSLTSPDSVKSHSLITL